MKSGKVTSLALFLVVVLALTTMLSSFAAAAQLRFITLGTSTVGGVSYSVGAGMAELLTKVLGINVTAEATGGSAENCRRIGMGQMDMGISKSETTYYAYHGVGPFEGDPHPNLRALFNMYVEPCQIAVRKDSSIRSFTDLRDKRVAVGMPGSGNYVQMETMLAAHGMSMDDLRPALLTYSEATEAMKDGTVDAALYAMMTPGAAVVDLSSTLDIRFIPIEGAPAEKIVKENPGYAMAVVPAGAYRGVDEPTPTVGTSIGMVVRADLPEDVAYNIVKTIFESLEQLETVHMAISQMSIEIADDVPIPLHPGAARYFEEIKGNK